MHEPAVSKSTPPHRTQSKSISTAHNMPPPDRLPITHHLPTTHRTPPTAHPLHTAHHQLPPHPTHGYTPPPPHLIERQYVTSQQRYATHTPEDSLYNRHIPPTDSTCHTALHTPCTTHHSRHTPQKRHATGHLQTTSTTTAATIRDATQR
jgi:hypothetical protein